MDWLEIITNIADGLLKAADIAELGKNSKAFNTYIQLYALLRYLADRNVECKSTEGQLRQNEIDKLTADFAIFMQDEYDIDVHLQLNWK
ncbi:MAG: hypothetical protein IJ191_08515 [Treponema sp.]|nr:hypothetical protein [Treponema sp.]